MEEEHGKIPYYFPGLCCSNPLLLCVSIFFFDFHLLQLYACYCVYCVDRDLNGPLGIGISNAFQIVELQILFHLNIF